MSKTNVNVNVGANKGKTIYFFKISFKQLRNIILYLKC